MRTNRDELADVLRKGRELWLDPDDALAIAKDLHLAGFRRVSRETITTVDELIALPDGAVLITKHGTACQIAKYDEDAHYLHWPGSDQSSTLDEVSEDQRITLAGLLPAEVIRP